MKLKVIIFALIVAIIIVAYFIIKHLDRPPTLDGEPLKKISDWDPILEPFNTISKPSNNPTNPVNNSAKSIVNPAKPSNNPTKSIVNSIKPSNNPTKPSNNPTKPSSPPIKLSRSDLVAPLTSNPNTCKYFLDIIKKTYLDTKHNFNAINLPVLSRTPNANTAITDKKYIYHIKHSVKSWAETFGPDMIVNNIKPIFIRETDKEFIVQTNTVIMFCKTICYLDLTFYGQIDKTDDFLNGGSDIYIIQLVSAKPLKKSDYNQEVKEYCPFMTMNEAMTYVDQINKTHAEEYEQWSRDR